MTEVRIERADLDPLLAGHAGRGLFQAALESAGEPEALLRVLARYILFNSAFGPGVANLAGEIGVRRDLFRDRDEPLLAFADRSVEVAADVFFAAVDEFDDRVAPYRDTHRSLAQATLRGTAEWFRLPFDVLERGTRLDRATENAIRTVEGAYGVSQPVDERKLMEALGFHLGSELLADEEFDVLDRHLRERHPALVEDLRRRRVVVGDQDYPCYFWIQVHTSVEVDHFEAAVRSGNAALRYFRGAVGPRQAKAWMLDGFRHFQATQLEFLGGLTAA